MVGVGKLHVGADNVAAMDQFAQDEYNNHTTPGARNAPGPWPPTRRR